MARENLLQQTLLSSVPGSANIYVVSGGVDYRTTKDAFLAGISGGYQGELAIADTPSADGFYLATEAGTYTNAGSLVVTLDGRVTFIDVSSGQTVFGKTEINIDATNLVTNSGLSVTCGAFTLGIKDSNIDFSSDSVTLPANESMFLFRDLVDGTLHYTRRDYQDGVVYVAYAETNGSTVTTLSQITPELPKTRVGNFVEKLNTSSQPVRVAVLGDSLCTSTGSETGISFLDMLFDATESSFGQNVNGLSRVTVDNYASGGQTSLYGQMWTGKGVRSLGQAFNNTGLSYDNVGQATNDSYSNFLACNDSPLFTKDYDLVIIGFGANGGTYKFAWYENLVKLIRDKGIEVMLFNQNNRASGGVTSNTSHLDDVYIVKELCDAYNCAYVNSYDYVIEQAFEGVTTHADDIHLLNAGKQAVANAFRTVLNEYVLDHERTGQKKQRFIKQNDDAWLSRNFYNFGEVDCHPTVNDGTLVASSASDFINPAVQFAGKAASSSVISLAVGETARFSHDNAISYSVIYDKSMTGSFEVNEQNGTIQRATSGSLTFTGTNPGIIEGRNLIGSGNILGNLSVEVECLTGTTKIYGILWHTFKNYTIPLDEIKTTGTWLSETGSYNAPNTIYTDTLNDSCTFSFVGSGCTVTLNSRTASGIVDVYLNGDLYEEDLDLYNASTFYNSLYITKAEDGYYDCPLSENTVTIHLKGVNGSAAASAAANRRLQIYQVKVFDRR